MRYLWNMLNKEFTIEGAVSAFLVINMIGWMAATMGAGMLICKFLGFSITGIWKISCVQESTED